MNDREWTLCRTLCMTRLFLLEGIIFCQFTKQYILEKWKIYILFDCAFYKEIHAKLLGCKGHLFPQTTSFYLRHTCAMMMFLTPTTACISCSISRVQQPCSCSCRSRTLWPGGHDPSVMGEIALVAQVLLSLKKMKVNPNSTRSNYI